MDANKLKKYAFTIKALESKNMVVDEILARTEEEIQSLPLSNTLINTVLEMKADAVPADFKVLKDEFIDLQRAADVEPVPDELSKYQVELPVVTEETLQEPVLDSAIIIHHDEEEPDEVAIVEPEAVVVAEVDVTATETIERTIANPEDVQAVREVLAKSEQRTVAALLKVVRKELPQAILESVPADVITNLCAERVKEVKEQK